MLKSRNEFTKRLLKESDITEGSRVLDVGCGTGAVTVLVSNIVGLKGKVIGIDNNEDLIKAAENNIQQENITFLEGDFNNLNKNLGLFDCIIGRRVLMYNNLDNIANLLPFLKNKGELIFHESDSNIPSVNNKMTYHSRAQEIIWKTLKKEDVDIETGSKLYSTYKNLNLKVEKVLSEQHIQTSETGSDLGWLLESMKEQILKHGIVDEKFDFEFFKEKINEELSNSNQMFVREVNYGIIGRKIKL